MVYMKYVIVVSKVYELSIHQTTAGKTLREKSGYRNREQIRLHTYITNQPHSGVVSMMM